MMQVFISMFLRSYSVVSAAVPGDRAVDQGSGSVDGRNGAGSLDGEG